MRLKSALTAVALAAIIATPAWARHKVDHQPAGEVVIIECGPGTTNQNFFTFEVRRFSEDVSGSSGITLGMDCATAIRALTGPFQSGDRFREEAYFSSNSSALTIVFIR